MIENLIHTQPAVDEVVTEEKRIGQNRLRSLLVMQLFEGILHIEERIGKVFLFKMGFDQAVNERSKQSGAFLFAKEDIACDRRQLLDERTFNLGSESRHRIPERLRLIGSLNALIPELQLLDRHVCFKISIEHIGRNIFDQLQANLPVFNFGSYGSISRALHRCWRNDGKCFVECSDFGMKESADDQVGFRPGEAT